MKSKSCELQKEDDDWICKVCGKTYTEDEKLKTGAKWIQCSFCQDTIHEGCQGQDINDDTSVYMCDACCRTSSDESE